MANATIWPPDTFCWEDVMYDWPLHSLDDAKDTCGKAGLANVTTGMIDFLNLTSFDNYFQAYCNNPTQNDSCPFNVCPNSDVAGILTRISIYLSSFLLAILVYYSKDMDKVKDSYWAQNFTVYSVIVAALISFAQQNMSKLHTVVAMEFVGSPLTFYMAFYAIRTMFGNKHRMSELFDGRRVWYRATALATFAVWAILLGMALGLSHDHYAQSNCQHRMKMIDMIYILPVYVIIGLIEKFPEIAVILLSPALLVIVSWGVAIYRRRKTLWRKNGVRRWPNFFDVWTMVGHDYPFVHFMSVVTLPFVFWLSTIEISLLSSNDNKFQSSFGQILALFVALPPLVSVLELVPRCGRWFWDLSWVRLISFRPQHSRRGSLDRNDIFDLTGEPTLGIRRTETAGSDATKWGGDDPYAGHDDYHKGAHGYATVNMKDSDL